MEYENLNCGSYDDVPDANANENRSVSAGVRLNHSGQKIKKAQWNHYACRGSSSKFIFTPHHVPWCDTIAACAGKVLRGGSVREQ